MYNFYCTAHGDMIGDITVAAPVNAPPTVTAGRTPSGDATTGTSIAFTATGTDTDGDTLTYAWDFGDGDTSTQQNPTHTYATPGTKTAKVTVSDGKGGTATATLTIVVTQANRNPTVTGGAHARGCRGGRPDRGLHRDGHRRRRRHAQLLVGLRRLHAGVDHAEPVARLRGARATSPPR